MIVYLDTSALVPLLVAEPSSQTCGELWDSADDVAATRLAFVELQEGLMLDAASMAQRHGLRGYDAVHCAAAVAANDELLVAASGEQRLLAAWNAEGVAVCDTNA